MFPRPQTLVSAIGGKTPAKTNLGITIYKIKNTKRPAKVNLSRGAPFD
jgi:hypothetical protein|tara:strand:+ start:518 stop:661 length:144 start_codon:yes stop_codon:yes gene_type:complete